MVARTPKIKDDSRDFRHNAYSPALPPAPNRLHGDWISLTQQEACSILEAGSAEALMKFYEPWTDLNVHQIWPVMDLADFKKVLDAED